MCKWRSALSPGYHCRVSPEPGSDYCIFHEPGKKDVQRFKQKFYEQIDGDGPEEARNPRYDFRGYFFPTGIVASGGSREADQLILPKEIAGDFIGSEATIKGKASFRGAKIEGGASFRGAKIEGGASFWHATIEGDASFWHATIEEDANFRDAKIKGDADFGGATFKGEAHFWGATFKRHAGFRGAKFEHNASFGGAKFEHNASFGGATIEEDANFRDAKIGGNANLSEATIGGNADFSKATIGGNADFDFKRLSGGFSLTNASIGRLVRFDNPVFHERISFDYCVASGLDLGEGKPRLRGWGQQRSGVTLTDVSTGYSFWRFARLTFEKEGRKHEADAAHYFERMWRWKALRSVSLEEEAPKAGNRRWEKRVFTVLELLGIALILRVVHIELAELNLARVRQTSLRAIYTIMWLFDCVFVRWPTQYGASLLRLFVTWAVIIGGFAGAYTMLILKGFSVLEAPGVLGLGQAITSFWGALYFSVITFTTLGYGDIRPTAGLPSGLAAAEAVLGGIMMALTVLVIGRKFMR
ncbi:potassium channel family protein [Candidatus Bipolaricaulota bacterium]|nr:potassium channel family protein [Candidatus Bipolaricaulota bacterium]